MAGQLGIILTPYGRIPGAHPSEITRTTGGGRFLGPFDPRYGRDAEAGFYYDTQMGRAGGLGAWEGNIPNDFQLAQQRGMLTPNQGWIATKAGPYNGPWVPPNGWTPVGPTNVKIGVGLGDVAQDITQSAQVAQAAAQAATDAIIATLNAQHQRVFALTAISTAAVVIASVVGAIRTARLLRQESRHGG